VNPYKHAGVTHTHTHMDTHIHTNIHTINKKQHTECHTHAHTGTHSTHLARKHSCECVSETALYLCPHTKFSTKTAYAHTHNKYL
jgi:hypothetical protein